MFFPGNFGKSIFTEENLIQKNDGILKHFLQLLTRKIHAFIKFVQEAFFSDSLHASCGIIHGFTYLIRFVFITRLADITEEGVVIQECILINGVIMHPIIIDSFIIADLLTNIGFQVYGSALFIGKPIGMDMRIQFGFLFKNRIFSVLDALLSMNECGSEFGGQFCGTIMLFHENLGQKLGELLG